MATYEVKAKKAGCAIYKNASKSSTKIGFLLNGVTYKSTEQKNDIWYYIAGDIAGWCQAEYLSITGNGNLNSIDKEQAEVKPPVTTDGSFGGGGSSLDDKIYTSSGTHPYTNSGINDQTQLSDDELSGLTYSPNLDTYNIGSTIESYMDFKQTKGIFGMPYQYSPNVDRRLSGSKAEMEYGRKFSEKIMMNAPLLYLTPGRPQFMAGFTKDFKKSVAQKLYEGAAPSDLEELTNNKDGRYYTFAFAYDEYYSFVNTMCSNAAKFMGIANEKFDGRTLGNYNWANYKNKNLDTFISGNEYTCFYIDAESQISESFGNNTGDSSIASSINALSDLGKEAAFLMGNAAGIELEASIREGYQQNLESFTNFFNKWGGGAGTIANKLFDGVSSLAMGGHIAFPEIWKDSDYSTSYDITIKLASPDGDPLSQFINITVPYYHLLGFVMPQALGYNTYNSPFLVRASYGGGFNCEMGIITSMNVTKGPSWNIYKLPTEMTINLTIKDLYKVLAMSNQSSPAKFLKNTMFVDFLANSVGVNLNMPEMGRTLHLYNSIHANKFVNTFDNIGLSLNNFMSNAVSKLKILY